MKLISTCNHNLKLLRRNYKRISQITNPNWNSGRNLNYLLSLSIVPTQINIKNYAKKGGSKEIFAKISTTSNRLPIIGGGQDAWQPMDTFILFDNFISLRLNNLSRAFSHASVPAPVIRPSNLSSLTTINPLYRAPLGIISRCWFRPKDRRRRRRRGRYRWSMVASWK